MTHVAMRGEPSTPTASRSALDELDFGDPLMARNIEAAKRVLSRAIPILLLYEISIWSAWFVEKKRAERDLELEKELKDDTPV